MKIFINDKPADITLDTEKNLGDVLSGLEQWISHAGSRIRGVIVNDNDLSPDSAAAAFDMGIGDIEKLDIVVSSWRELAAEALLGLYETCTSYGNAAFDERMQMTAVWEKCAAARFLASDIPDLNDLARLAFAGEGLLPSDFILLIEERLREISNPEAEILDCETLVKSIAQRMEELPLDIQTGKDQRASETIQLFSRIGEKLFRVFFVYRSDGLSLDAFVIDTLPARVFMEEFNAVLRELSSAYENQDTVLAGDIAEYELSPRLLKFFNALKNIAASNKPVVSA